MNKHTQQLLPGFTIKSDAGFANFYTAPSIELVKNSLLDYVRHPATAFIYLCGVEGTGKSHLLQAVYNLAVDEGMTALYLPLRELKEYTPHPIFENTNSIDLLCIDDLGEVEGRADWETELFHVYNRRRLANQHTVFAAEKTARELVLQLPDLQTRLTACLGFQLPLLTDVEKAGLIQFRAALTGMEINDACVQYVIQRSGRSLSDLLAVLEQLDKESLVAGRKITVPFIKAVLHW